MKRLLLVFLSFVFLFSSLNVSVAEPERELAGVITYLKPSNASNGKQQSHLGPGGSYPGAGGYIFNEVVNARAIFQENDFVYVDISYCDGTRKCIYFDKWALTNKKVENLKLGKGTAASITAECQPSLGPGEEYSLLIERTAYGAQRDVFVPAGTQIQALLKSEDWVFAEVNCYLGKVRVWFPDSIVKCDSTIREIKINGINSQFDNNTAYNSYTPVNQNTANPAQVSAPNTTSETIQENKDTVICSLCGGISIFDYDTSCYSYVEDGHWYEYYKVYNCKSCHNSDWVYLGDTECVPHVFNDQNICAVCGYVKQNGVICDICGSVMDKKCRRYSQIYPYDRYNHTLLDTVEFWFCSVCGSEKGDNYIGSVLEPHSYDSDSYCPDCGFYDWN